MTAFFCLRHGMTDWNREHRIQGRTDTALNDEGREQARNWAEALAGAGFDLIVTSGLARARETGAILNQVLNLPMVEDARLNEQDWGNWTGLTRKELAKKGKLLNQQEKKGFDFRPEGGESRNEMLDRACDAFIDLSGEHPGKSVLVVTHNGVLRCLAHALSGSDYLPGDPDPIMPGRLHRFECAELELALGELNVAFARPGGSGEATE
ncbi:MAG: histidine phosphatase family protein [Desulfovibrionaceae bacterium]|nr:histidine phosphatase family protein [Desulfovibrionaceae bacterium]